MWQQDDPICALATPSGRGALAIVRLSGRGALEAAVKVTHKALPVREASYTRFYDDQGEVIDQGIAVYFQSPASFTGEDMVEFHCHGNPIVSGLLLKTLCANGARLATPGEFSLRAFVNNKIDLSQAEAIADLISSTTEQGVRAAVRSMQGAFSTHVHKILTKLIQIRTRIEAQLDFPDEEMDRHSRERMEVELVELELELNELLRYVERGKRLQSGAIVAIGGSPNVGKSSVLNALAQSDVAIVTEIPGTTRDSLTADIDIRGVPVQLIDTAGMRSTEDIVEKKGIERARKAFSQADIILWVSDVSQEEQAPPGEMDADRIIYVRNKIDLGNYPSTADKNQVYLSAKTGAGIQKLITALATRLLDQQLSDTPFLARHRHLIALQRAQESINAACQCANLSAGLELIAEELRCAQRSLGEISGEFTADDLLGRIFSEFCMGK